MTEEEYIKVSNKQALKCALAAMRDLLPGEGYGVDEKTCDTVTAGISMMLDAVFKELDGAINQ